MPPEGEYHEKTPELIRLSHIMASVRARRSSCTECAINQSHENIWQIYEMAMKCIINVDMYC